MEGLKVIRLWRVPALKALLINEFPSVIFCMACTVLYMCRHPCGPVYEMVHSICVGLMMGKRRRRWPSIK